MRTRYPADKVISAIEAGQVLPIKEVQKGSGWVSDELKEVVRDWDCNRPGLKPPVLINAPTGRGKNTFVQNVLAEHAAKQGRYVLLLTNRYTLNLQQKQSFSSSSNHPPFGTAMIENVKVFGHIICFLYHEVLGSLDWIISKYPIGFVVFDEAHFFCSDAVFNVDTYAIFQKLLWTFPRVKRIYMSATPEDIKWLIAYEEYVLYHTFKNPPQQQGQDTRGSFINQWSAMIAGNEYYITEYNFQRDYSFVNIHFFETWKSLKDIISEHDAEEKWLIFVSSKEDGDNLKKELEKSEFIDATYKDMCPHEIRELAKSRKFKPKILIATTVLYNGFSFEDDALKNIVVDSVNRMEVLQMLGRKRLSKGETINLFVLKHDPTAIKKFKQHCEGTYEIVQKFLYDPRLFNQECLGTLSETRQHLFKINPDYTVDINPHATYQLACLEGKYETFENRFTKEGNDAFIHEVCDWFGIDYENASYEAENMREKQYNEIRNQVVGWAEKYADKQMDFTTLNNAYTFLEIKVHPLIAQMNKEKKNTVRKIEGVTDVKEAKRRINANINHIFEYFSVPYQSKKLPMSKTNGKDIWMIITKDADSSNNLDDDTVDTEE